MMYLQLCLEPDRRAGRTIMGSPLWPVCVDGDGDGDGDGDDGDDGNDGDGDGGSW